MTRAVGVLGPIVLRGLQFKALPRSRSVQCPLFPAKPAVMCRGRLSGEERTHSCRNLGHCHETISTQYAHAPDRDPGALYHCGGSAQPGCSTGSRASSRSRDQKLITVLYTVIRKRQWQRSADAVIQPSHQQNSRKGIDQIMPDEPVKASPGGIQPASLPCHLMWSAFTVRGLDRHFLRTSRGNGDAPMPIDPREPLPRGRARPPSAARGHCPGLPGAPVLPDLLKWLQDCNWPVSRPISEFLASIPGPMAPLIRDVLEGNDLIWKYRCIQRLIRTMPREIAEKFRPDLIRLAEHPTSAEHVEELDEVATEAIEVLWPSGDEQSTAGANQADG